MLGIDADQRRASNGYFTYQRQLWGMSFSTAWLIVGSSPRRWLQIFAAGLGASVLIFLIFVPWLRERRINLGDHLGEKAILTAAAAFIFAGLAVPSLALLLAILYSPYRIWKRQTELLVDAQRAPEIDPRKLQAASTILRNLLPLHQKLETRFRAAKEWLSKGGQKGDIPITQDLHLAIGIDDEAALLGQRVAKACSRLRQSFVLNENWENEHRSLLVGRQQAEMSMAGVAVILIDMHILDEEAAAAGGLGTRLSRGLGPDELELASRRMRGSTAPI